MWYSSGRGSLCGRRSGTGGQRPEVGSLIPDSHNGKVRILRVSIFGLGYVGTVSAACLADDGHNVIGVDPVPTKVDLINRGQSPLIEEDIGEIIAAAVEAGRLCGT